MKGRSSVYKHFQDGKKKFAVLVDPDKFTAARVKLLAGKAERSAVDFIFYGGSLLTEDNHDSYITILKENCSIPVLLFPGNYLRINRDCDGILLLSLISGRNPEMLIGKHVVAAPLLKDSNLEILSTGYMLIDSGRPTAVNYMSNTTPIPSDKDDIAVCTAMAGEMLGMKLIYLDAGSGAPQPVPVSMIRNVRKKIGLPMIVGGGIRNSGQAVEISNAGADLVVVGNAIEKDLSLIGRIASAVHELNA
jgi:phosphoglycerol geranylgeranyltransferase